MTTEIKTHRFEIGHRVRYIPDYADGPEHPDCEIGVVSSFGKTAVRVKFDRYVEFYGRDEAVDQDCSPSNLQLITCESCNVRSGGHHVDCKWLPLEQKVKQYKSICQSMTESNHHNVNANGRLRKQVTDWQGRYSIVKTENNALRKQVKHWFSRSRDLASLFGLEFGSPTERGVSHQSVDDAADSIYNEACDLVREVRQLRDKNSKLVAHLRAWTEAAMRYYPLDWAMDPGNPGAMMANIVEFRQGPLDSYRLRVEGMEPVIAAVGAMVKYNAEWAVTDNDHYEDCASLDRLTADCDCGLVEMSALVNAYRKYQESLQLKQD